MSSACAMGIKSRWPPDVSDHERSSDEANGTGYRVGIALSE